MNSLFFVYQNHNFELYISVIIYINANVIVKSIFDMLYNEKICMHKTYTPTCNVRVIEFAGEWLGQISNTYLNLDNWSIYLQTQYIAQEFYV